MAGDIPGPLDPFGQFAEGNAQTVAMWSGLAAAGMPPMVAAVYLGQMMGSMAAQSAKPQEKPDGE